MNLTFITYADQKYYNQQQKLVASAKASGQFDYFLTYTRDDLIQTDFYRQNKAILDLPRGAGFCLWKPYLIKLSMQQIDYGEAVFYMDSADIFQGEIGTHIKSRFQNKDYILTLGGFPQKNYTKKDCFFYMHCDTEKYHNTTQLEAGILAFKKTVNTEILIDEWLLYCSDARIVTDQPNLSGPDYPGYIDHRYDQSVLTNLYVKYDLSASNELRDYIKCNVND